MDGTCWICRTSKSYLFFNFKDYLEMYKFSVNSKFENEEKFLICAHCATKIQNFNAFKKQCLESENYWQIQNAKETYNVDKAEQEIADIAESEADVQIESNLDMSNEECSEIDVDEDPDEVIASRSRFQGICDICKQLFRRKHLLLKHLQSCGQPALVKKIIKIKKPVPKEDALYCGICDWKASDAQQINPHLKAHFEAKDLKCKLCSFEGKDFAHMISHRFEHQPKDSEHYKCVCFVCSYYSSTAKPLKLEYHVRTAHLRARGGLCALCARTFSRYGRYRQHRRFHLTGGLPCHQCDLRYEHQPKGVDHYKCECFLCTYSIPCAQPIKLEFHVRATHLRAPGGLCVLCARVYTKYETYRDHYQFHKTGGIACKHCGLKFINKGQLQCHLLIHAEKKFMCTLCGYRGRRAHALKLHMATHKTTRNVRCGHCNVLFKGEISLKSHLKRINKEKKFLCHICSKPFVYEREFKEHVFRHSGVRPYKCDICNKAYKAKAVLKTHYLRRHSNVPVQCEVCNRGYDSFPALQCHLRRSAGCRKEKDRS